MTIAERVAQEMGCQQGKEVGYAVRFEDKWDPEHTKIKFVTDGLLLRETMRDPLLSRYSVIMLVSAVARMLYEESFCEVPTEVNFMRAG